jgi:hypothetical protein
MTAMTPTTTTPTTATPTTTTPSRDDGGTTGDPRCAGCGQPFTPTGRQRHCSTRCRKRVFRARHRGLADQALQQSTPGVSGSRTRASRTGWTRREHTVYECPDCGTRQLGVQRCEDCGRFGRAAGLGGHCPGCDEPVTLADLGLAPHPADGTAW